MIMLFPRKNWCGRTVPTVCWPTRADLAHTCSDSEAERTQLLGREFDRDLRGIEHDEVVARALHLGETQLHAGDYGALPAARGGPAVPLSTPAARLRGGS